MNLDVYLNFSANKINFYNFLTKFNPTKLCKLPNSTILGTLSFNKFSQTKEKKKQNYLSKCQTVETEKLLYFYDAESLHTHQRIHKNNVTSQTSTNKRETHLKLQFDCANTEFPEITIDCHNDTEQKIMSNKFF